jgi:tetratricopeptide (TPR) repeat protein
MIFLSLAGCATLKEMEAKREAREYLITAQRLFNQGDYEGSVKENQKALSLYDHVPPGDEALFNTGLIYAHSGNPQRDYQKSLDHFTRLVKVFPLSPLAMQAKIWIGVLQENERLTRETEESNKSIRKSQQENERLNKEIEKLKEAIQKSKQIDIEIDEKKKELSK